MMIIWLNTIKVVLGFIEKNSLSSCNLRLTTMSFKKSCPVICVIKSSDVERFLKPANSEISFKPSPKFSTEVLCSFSNPKIATD